MAASGGARDPQGSWMQHRHPKIPPWPSLQRYPNSPGALAASGQCPAPSGGGTFPKYPTWPSSSPSLRCCHCHRQQRSIPCWQFLRSIPPAGFIAVPSGALGVTHRAQPAARTGLFFRWKRLLLRRHGWGEARSLGAEPGAAALAELDMTSQSG